MGSGGKVTYLPATEVTIKHAVNFEHTLFTKDFSRTGLTLSACASKQAVPCLLANYISAQHRTPSNYLPKYFVGKYLFYSHRHYLIPVAEALNPVL